MKKVIFLLFVLVLVSSCSLEVLKMGKDVVMVVAPDNFRDEELFDTKQVLEEGGANVKIASMGTGKATGMLGGEIDVDLDYSEIVVDDYDAVIFIGGGGAAIYFNDEKALSLAKEAYEKEKVVGAICIAPSILANAGILEGKKATAYTSEVGNLRVKGAEYTGGDVVVDGKIVTADGPSAATKFGEKILETL